MASQRHVRTTHELRFLELIEEMGPAGRVALAQAARLAEARDDNRPITLAEANDFFEVLVGHLGERTRDERTTERELGSIKGDIEATGRLVRRIFQAGGILRVVAAKRST